MLTQNYNVVSVMSGTSLDGIDILHTKFSFNDTWQFEILNFETVAYAEEWNLKLKHLTKFSKAELKDLDIDYSELLANQILSFINSNKIKNLDFVASHGHTALHNPEENYTYQIGNLQSVADILGQKLICDFRVQDIKLGGQGAPLVPIGDMLLFHEYDFCLNLGGFANISYQQKESRIAFDICPVNIVLNHYVAKLGFDYDDKGKIAETGTLNLQLLETLNNLEFYKLHPPKSLGLEWVLKEILPIIESFNLKVEAVLRTVVEHVAIQISKYINEKHKTVLITGGGAYNSFLVDRIEALSASKIVIPKNEIIEYKEALIFGLLGVLKERNEVNCLKSVTGASKNHSSGVIFNP